MGSTGDKISGKVNEMAGKAKKTAGKATGDREMQAKGGMAMSMPLHQRSASRDRMIVSGPKSRMCSQIGGA